jgi:hypothetical protein
MVRLRDYLLWRYVGVAVIALVGLALSGSQALAASGDANEAVCANEALAGFEEYLPDCRAYELVTPPFADGFRTETVAMSEDGSRMLTRSLGAFAGTQSDGEDQGGAYEFTRSATGWEASAISPPASLYPANEFFAASANLDKSLWALHTPSQSIATEDLYLREPNGLFVEIGPMLPPSATAGPPAGGSQNFLELAHYDYAGASSDLAHVLFEIVAPAPLWPGDATRGEHSLYEYVGTGNRQPALVGVAGDGALISECETALGSQESGDTYNAVSKDGEVVFFTAAQGDCEGGAKGPEVNELYARLAGIESVSISQPSPRQCETCDHEAPKMPAVFQGASEDGSKVFFLSEQQLFSGAQTMNLYEYDFENVEGSRVVRVSAGSPGAVGSVSPEVQGVARVSEDGTHVYFVAKGVLTTGQNAEHREPQAGKNNLYLFERDSTFPSGRTTFIATLSSETQAELAQHEQPCEALSGEPKEECEEPYVEEYNKQNGADAEDWSEKDEHRPVQATPDGRFLVFRSVADLTPGDTSSEPQVFEYDSVKEELVRVSVGQSGYARGATESNTHGSSILRPKYAGAFYPSEVDKGLTVSADGSEVVFNSAGGLTAGSEGAAAVGAESAYEYRSSGSEGTIAGGDVYVISDGVNTRNAELVGIDPSGQDIFFETSDPLVAQDVDTQFSVYDARAGGGFSSLPGVTECTGEACQGEPASVSPPSAPPGSLSAPGGNLVPAPAPSVVRRAKAKVRPLTRAQHLAKALSACHRNKSKRNKSKLKRISCEKNADKRYGAKSKAKAKSRKGGK